MSNPYGYSGGKDEDYHAAEAIRIDGIVESLKGDRRYAPDGVVMTVLKWRADQERERAKGTR